MKRKRAAPNAASAHSGDSRSTVFAAMTRAAQGNTMRFGMIRRSTSVTVIATSAQQKSAATRASPEKPKRRKQPDTRSAVAASTAGYFHGMAAWHERQRPSRSPYESRGTLSYQAIGVSQLMQAEPGETSDRRSGTRAATTLRKLPTARPGANASAAIAAVIRPSPRPPLVVARETAPHPPHLSHDWTGINSVRGWSWPAVGLGEAAAARTRPALPPAPAPPSCRRDRRPTA